MVTFFYSVLKLQNREIGCGKAETGSKKGAKRAQKWGEKGGKVGLGVLFSDFLYNLYFVKLLVFSAEELNYTNIQIYKGVYVIMGVYK